MSLRLPLLAALALSFGACDTYHDDDRGDVVVVDFTIDGDRFDVSDDGRVASFDTDDVESADGRAGLRVALREAGDGALVVAYIDSEAVLAVEGTGQTYSALPLTRGYDAEFPILIDEDGDGTPEEIPYVDLVVTYEYSFDNEDFYFDVTSNAALDFDSFFGDFLPQDLDLRVVSIPADVYYGRAGARIDLRDYAAVKAAFDLPD